MRNTYIHTYIHNIHTLNLSSIHTYIHTVHTYVTLLSISTCDEGSPSFLHLYSFLDKKGFALFDVADVTRIATGIAIQFDPTFVRKSSKIWTKECTGFPTPAYFNASSSSFPGLG